MSKPVYEKKNVRKAMLLAPIAGLLGVLPFIFKLDISIGQFLLIPLAALVVSYLFGLLIGAPVYLALKALGYSQTKYLMLCAMLLVIATPIMLGDIYALVNFAPPTLVAAGLFCYLRGSAIEAPEAADETA